MASRALRAALIAALALFAFGAGLATGSRTGWNRTQRLLTVEVHGNLSHRVETLARLRTGDAAGAIALLEQAVDGAIETLPQGQRWSALEPELRLTLQMAKAYQQRYPQDQPRHTLTALLETIPMPDVKYCSPAMQDLLRSASQ
jgi:hypothetical protein